MRRMISSLVLLAAVLMPNCATFVAHNPEFTRVIENYNCRKGYAPCVTRIEVEVIHVYQD